MVEGRVKVWTRDMGHYKWIINWMQSQGYKSMRKLTLDITSYFLMPLYSF